MEYFAGLDVSMEETHVCVVDHEGAVVLEGKSASTPEAICRALQNAPSTCRQVVFETGRMAPMLYHGLRELGVAAVCIESRQAHHALQSLRANKTDRNDARGLAQLARTGFYKETHVKSLPAHAVRALIAARKKLVGQRLTIENQIRGLVIVFGERLPRGKTKAFRDQVLALSAGVPGLSSALRGLIDARDAILLAIAAIDRDVQAMSRSSEACRLLMTVPGVGDQFYQPTIVRGVSPDMAIACEEVFGPILTVLTFRTMDEAIKLTNGTEYGLSAGIWSDDVHNCLEFSRRAQAGTVWTNTWMDGFPELTFGGMKQSGQGREIGQYGFDEFLEVKSLVMRIGRTREPWVKTPWNDNRANRTT